MNKREHLIQVSYEYFLSHGYVNSTIKDILNEANVSRGGFYHHFKSKDELLIEVIEKYYVDQINESMHFLSTCNSFRDYINHLDLLLKEYTKQDNSENNHLYAISFMLEAVKEVPAAAEFMKKMYSEILKLYTEFIKRQQNLNEIKAEIYAQDTAKFLISLVEGFFIMGVYFSDNWDSEYVLNTLEAHYKIIRT